MLLGEQYVSWTAFAPMHLSVFFRPALSVQLPNMDVFNPSPSVQTVFAGAPAPIAIAQPVDCCENEYPTITNATKSTIMFKLSLAMK